MAKKRTTTIELDAAAMEALDAYCEKGRKKGYVISRLVEWFVDQEDSVKTLVMGELSPEEIPVITESLLCRFAGHPPSKPERRARA